MLKRVLIFLVLSPFMGGALFLGALLHLRGSVTCGTEQTKVTKACERISGSGTSSCISDGDLAYRSCMDGYSGTHGLGTGLVIGSIFLALGSLFGFRNVATYTGVVLLATIVVNMATAGRRR